MLSALILSSSITASQQIIITAGVMGERQSYIQPHTTTTTITMVVAEHDTHTFNWVLGGTPSLNIVLLQTSPYLLNCS